MPVGAARETVGWVEKVRVYPGNVLLKAKIDSGAKTSSLHCDFASVIERNGKQWVAFTVINYKGELIKLEKKLERLSKIKRHFGEVQERYVIKLGICLGQTYKETEVNLIDRSGMNYQILIGRRFLKGSHVIDPALTFASKPNCIRPEDRE
jgi:hypothetical protein